MLSPTVLAAAGRNKLKFDLLTYDFVGDSGALLNNSGLPILARNFTISSTGEYLFTGNYSSAGLNSAEIFRYDFGTPWDVTTLSTTPNQTYDASTDVGGSPPTTFTSAFVGIGFSADGTKCLAFYNPDDKLYEYTLSTPWDLTTMSFIKSTSIFGAGWVGTIPATVIPTFSYQGDYFVMTFRNITGPVAKRVLTSPWTASIDALESDTDFVNMLPTATSLDALTMSANGQHIYAATSSGGTTIHWEEVSPLHDISTWISNNSPEESNTSAALTCIFVKPNGEYMYHGVGSSGVIRQRQLYNFD